MSAYYLFSSNKPSNAPTPTSHNNIKNVLILADSLISLQCLNQNSTIVIKYVSFKIVKRGKENPFLSLASVSFRSFGTFCLLPWCHLSGRNISTKQYISILRKLWFFIFFFSNSWKWRPMQVVLHHYDFSMLVMEANFIHKAHVSLYCLKKTEIFWDNLIFKMPKSH